MNEQLNGLLEKCKEIGPQSTFLIQAFDILMEHNKELLPYVSDFEIHYYYEPAIGSYNNEKRIKQAELLY